MNQNNKPYLIIDIGNTKTKFAYYHNNKLVIKKSLNQALNDQFIISLINKHHIKKVFIGSVVNHILALIQEILNKYHISYQLMEKSWFYDEIKLNKIFNQQEIGLDILGYCYYVSKLTTNALCINLGTASVFFTYTNQLDTILIGPNFSSSWLDLYHILNINPTTMDSEPWTKPVHKYNTLDSVNEYKSLLINGFIKQILTTHPYIYSIYISGGDRHLFKKYLQIRNKISIKYINEATIRGYFLLISEKF